MNIPKEAWPIIATGTAAFVAGTVSLVVSVLSKEQKISEFRQSWIDALRADLAEYAAALIVTHDMIYSRIRAGEVLKEIQLELLRGDTSSFRQIEMLRLRLLFRLNPIEHKKLVSAIDSAYHYSPGQEEKYPELGEKRIRDFTDEAQTVLKKEWKRVKRGETWFIIVKWAALGLMFLPVALAIRLNIT